MGIDGTWTISDDEKSIVVKGTKTYMESYSGYTDMDGQSHRGYTAKNEVTPNEKISIFIRNKDEPTVTKYGQDKPLEGFQKTSMNTQVVDQRLLISVVHPRWVRNFNPKKKKFLG